MPQLTRGRRPGIGARTWLWTARPRRRRWPAIQPLTSTVLYDTANKDVLHIQGIVNYLTDLRGEPVSCSAHSGTVRRAGCRGAECGPKPPRPHPGPSLPATKPAPGPASITRGRERLRHRPTARLQTWIFPLVRRRALSGYCPVSVPLPRIPYLLRGQERQGRLF